VPVVAGVVRTVTVEPAAVVAPARDDFAPASLWLPQATPERNSRYKSRKARGRRSKLRISEG